MSKIELLSGECIEPRYPSIPYQSAMTIGKFLSWFDGMDNRYLHTRWMDQFFSIDDAHFDDHQLILCETPIVNGFFRKSQLVEEIRKTSNDAFWHRQSSDEIKRRVLLPVYHVRYIDWSYRPVIRFDLMPIHEGDSVGSPESREYQIILGDPMRDLGLFK